ncbi:UNVERIFIED_CONTAM: hypothetical protein K2H54_065019 [Gekko kuhli]
MLHSKTDDEQGTIPMQKQGTDLFPSLLYDINFQLTGAINKRSINTRALGLAVAVFFFSPLRLVRAKLLSNQAEEGVGARPKPSHASRLEDLRLKLENDGFTNVSFVVVNHQGPSSQKKYPHLREKVSENIPVYQQGKTQPDVWTVLNGKKDDFLIYDRCGRLVYHLGLPYSFLTFPYVEDAIHVTYCESTCGNCSYMTPEIEERCSSLTKVPTASTEEAPPPPRHHGHHHGHLLSENQNQYGTGHAHRHRSGQVQQHRVGTGDRVSCWQRTSLSLDSDDCPQLLDSHKQRASLSCPMSESETKGQEAEPDEQSKHL